MGDARTIVITGCGSIRETLKSLPTETLLELRDALLGQLESQQGFRMPTFDVAGPREEPTSFDVDHKPRRRNVARRGMAGDGRI
jgi:hypothetical protein